MRIELTRVGLLVYLANHYTTRGAQAPELESYNSIQFSVILRRSSILILYKYLRKSFGKHRFKKILPIEQKIYDVLKILSFKRQTDLLPLGLFLFCNVKRQKDKNNLAPVADTSKF